MAKWPAFLRLQTTTLYLQTKNRAYKNYNLAMNNKGIEVLFCVKIQLGEHRRTFGAWYTIPKWK